MRRVVLDGRTITTDVEFHARISSVLEFPDYYGRNLDALWDCLCSLAEPAHVIWTHHRESDRAMGPRFDEIRKVLDERTHAYLDAHGEPYTPFQMSWE